MGFLGVASNICKINYFYIPKCACTLGRQLWYACHPEDMNKPAPSKEWHDITADFPAPNRDYPSLLMIRDPFKRAVSMYSNRVCMARAQGFDHLLRAIQHSMGKQDISFLDFCRFLEKSKSEGWSRVDAHFVPQTLIDPQMKAYILPEDLPSGKITLIDIDGNIQQEYLEFYRKHVPLRLQGLMELRIRQFFDRSRNNINTNVSIRKPFPNLPADCSNINMVGWSEFPQYERFATPETLGLIWSIYAEDYRILGHKLIRNSFSIPLAPNDKER